VNVLWGYGLSVDKPGDFVKKPMSVCNGREIMTEIMGHLHMEADASKILESCVCIPCMMPFVTSQFLRRNKGDRPQVVPARSKNLAYIGQFCELPDDVVFTVEYSIRSAQTAVYSDQDYNVVLPDAGTTRYSGILIGKTFVPLFIARLHDSIESCGPLEWVLYYLSSTRKTRQFLPQRTKPGRRKAQQSEVVADS
jgi:myosin-crossreactive antigen